MRLVEKGLENRERKCSRFTATGLRKADDVAVLQGKRNRFRLDRGRLFVSKVIAGFAEGVNDALGLLSVIMLESRVI